MNLSKKIKITKVKAAAVTATTELVSDVVDMQNYDGVIFFTTIGSANAGNYLKVQQDAVVGMTGAVDLAGKKVVATAAGEVVWLDIYRPTDRFLTANVIRAGATTIVGDIYAIQYNGRVLPEANVTTDVILGALLISPEEKAVT